MNIKISTCSNYDATKGKDVNNTKVAEGWKLEEIKWEKSNIVKLSTQYGVSGNEYVDGKRDSSHWVATHSIMLDFDQGTPTAEDLLEIQQKWEFDSYIFSSQNHQKPKSLKSGKTEPPVDRLRALIPLSDPILGEFERKAVQQALVNQYKSVDETFMGQTRYFAHGTTEVSSFVFGKGAMT